MQPEGTVIVAEENWYAAPAEQPEQKWYPLRPKNQYNWPNLGCIKIEFTNQIDIIHLFWINFLSLNIIYLPEHFMNQQWKREPIQYPFFI